MKEREAAKTRASQNRQYHRRAAAAKWPPRTGRFRGEQQARADRKDRSNRGNFVEQRLSRWIHKQGDVTADDVEFDENVGPMDGRLTRVLHACENRQADNSQDHRATHQWQVYREKTSTTLGCRSADREPVVREEHERKHRRRLFRRECRDPQQHGRARPISPRHREATGGRTASPV